jgi:hypothetical protein
LVISSARASNKELFINHSSQNNQKHQCVGWPQAIHISRDSLEQSACHQDNGCTRKVWVKKETASNIDNISGTNKGITKKYEIKQSGGKKQQHERT